MTTPRTPVRDLESGQSPGPRPSVLFLSQCLPYPPHSGVTNRAFHVLCELQKEFDVTLLAFSRRNHQSDADARARAREALSETLSHVVEPVPISSEWSRPSKLWNHLRSVIRSRPYTYYEYAGAGFERQLEATIHQAAPDLVHLDSLDLYRWMDAASSRPRACTHHSIESDLLRLRAQRIAALAPRSYLYYQADLVERLEAARCPRFDVNVMMSEIDAVRLKVLAPEARTLVAPNGVNTEYFRPARNVAPVSGQIVFLGPTYMAPNRDAVDFFLTEIWPAVRRRVGGGSLHLIGKNPGTDRARFLAHPGVVCHGYVPDVRPPMEAAECSIVPIRIGGGTRLKILDSWAMAKAVVSTTIGCEGLDARDGDNILIRDDPSDFADAVVEVLSNPGLRRRLEDNGRSTVERTYAWPIIGGQLRACYRGLIARGGFRRSGPDTSV